MDNIFGLSFAQNVLLTNKETSAEEIQAFFNRDILCEYNNTLFVVEINDTFSIHEQSIMNNYLKISNIMSNIKKILIKKHKRLFRFMYYLFIWWKK